MKAKYMKFFKRNIIVLVILLIVVFFSFGISYSNFVYNSIDHRAVEMHINKLKYNIKINDENTNNIVLTPGNNTLIINIESLNEVKTYFKLLTLNNDNIDIYYYENEPYGMINENGNITIKLLTTNKTNENITCELLVSSGYINNTLDDINIPDNYIEIKNKINIGDNIEYKIDETKRYNYNDLELLPIKSNYRILNINDNGTLDIISNEPINLSNQLIFKGSNGYNNIIYLLNNISSSLYSSNYSINIRNLNLDDIEKYTNKTLVNYNEIIKTYNENIYIPSLYEQEKNSIINNIHVLGNIDRSENNTYINSNYKIVNSITLNEMEKINKIDSNTFIKPIYYELFIEKNNKYYNPYYLLTRYAQANENNVSFGIFSINNNEINKCDLYDTDNNEYDINLMIRPIITLSNNTKINYDSDSNTWKIGE